MARRLKKDQLPQVEIAESRATITAVQEAWKDAAGVIVVDAVVSGGPPGAIYRFDAHGAGVPVQLSRSLSSHGWGVAEALALGNVFQELPPWLIIYGVVGKHFGPGQEVSPVVPSAIPVAAGAIERVFLQPDDVAAFPDALQAILAADLIVAGPGSLYTSIIPNLLVRDIAAAVAASRATKVYVCNAATQPGETEGYSVLDHVQALEAHAGKALFPIVIANDRQLGKLLPGLQWVALGQPVNGAHRIIAADVAAADKPWRHDSVKLANVLMKLIDDNLVSR